MNEGETMILTKLSLKFYLILGLLLLVVCGCATVTPIEENTASTSSELPTETSSDHELEIMSPWSAGGGLEALQAVVSVFELQNPRIEVVNAADSGLTYP